MDEPMSRAVNASAWTCGGENRDALARFTASDDSAAKFDDNVYLAGNRTPPFRQRSPKDMKNRRKPGWTDCQVVLPRVTLEGLSHLAKTMADQERWERSRAPRGFRRRYPKTKNYFVVKALNYLLKENGLSQFCVEETEATPGRVCRFVAPGD
jgi:hypothetical protein